MSDDPFDPIPGQVETLRPGLRRILAPNASPMTYRGTNTYILGTDSLALIDPGPESAQHLSAILAAVGDTPLTHIFVTHSHVDHSPLAAPLAEKTGARIIAFGDSYAGQSDVMRRLAADGYTGGGEGVDHAFKPDVCLADGEAIACGAGQLRAIHTPGHMGNHLCFKWEDVMFSGDHVMGWASSMVSPPDGDIRDFMTSCRKLLGTDANTFYPGHGAPITDPAGRLTWLIKHREDRTAQIIAQLGNGPADVMALTEKIYAESPATLHKAAARNVFAQLIDLHGQDQVSATPTLTVNQFVVGSIPTAGAKPSPE